MAVTGVKGQVTATTLSGNAYQRAFDKMLHDKWARVRALAVLALSTPMKTIDSYKRVWWEDNSRHRTNDALAGNLAAGDAEMTVTDGTKFLQDDVWELKDDTNSEQIIVNGVPNGVTIPIARAIDGGTAYAFVSGVKLIFIGNASKEGAAVPASTATSPEEKYNYVTETRVTFELTDWQRMMNMEWGKEERRLKDLKYNDFIEQIEKSALFGRRSLRQVDGKNQTTAAGLLSQITTHNVLVSTITSGTTLTKAALLAIFEMTGDNEAEDRYLLTSNWFMGNIVNGFALDQMQTKVTDSKYGIKIRQLVTLFGDYDCVTSRLFHHYGSTNRYDLYGSYAVIMPKSNLSQFGFGENGNFAFKMLKPENRELTRSYLGEHSVTRGWQLNNEDECWAIYGTTGVA